MTNVKLARFKKMKVTYRPQDLEAAEKLAAEVSAFHKCHVEARVSEHKGEYNCERFEVVLTTDPCRITISWSDYHKRYSIFADLGFKNLDNYSLSNVRGQFEEPNEIGKLSAKKITDWIAYHGKCYETAKDKDTANRDRITAFMESIKGENVKWWNDNSRGEIVKNGIEFQFTIGQESVQAKISIHYKAGSDLATFKLLADNNYKG